MAAIPDGIAIAAVLERRPERDAAAEAGLVDTADEDGGTDNAGQAPRAAPSRPDGTSAGEAIAAAARRAAAAAARGAAGEAARLLGTASDRAASHLAAGLKPARDLGRAVEGRRIAVETEVRGAVSDAAYRARRGAVSAGLHGVNLAGAAGRTTVALLADPALLVETGAIFAEARREIAEALAAYDRAAAVAAQHDRERLARDAVARLRRWDHPTTRHHASSWLHVSIGPGRAEAWGMVLRGPLAGRSLAALAPAVLAGLVAEAPDAETAAALEAWRRAVTGS